MNEEIVVRRKWVSPTEFLDMLAMANLIPGPNSTELALHIGYRRAGLPGLLIAGVCFIAPAALMVTFLAWFYVRYGVVPQVEHILYFVKPVVIAIIFKAAVDLGRTAIKSTFLGVLAVCGVVANILGVNELAVLFFSGFIAMAIQSPKTSVNVLWAIPTMSVGSGSLFGYFLKVGAVLYGSGYVLIALLQADLVDRLGWITQQQLLDAVAVGQVTPGPLFTTATFIGYLLGGPWGALMATLGIFLPAFILVAVTQPLLRKARNISWMHAFLDGVNAAAIALIVVVVGHLAQSAVVDAITGGTAVVSALLLMRVRSIWLIAAAVVLGLLR